jgi:hypothetical protein
MALSGPKEHRQAIAHTERGPLDKMMKPGIGVELQRE